MSLCETCGGDDWDSALQCIPCEEKTRVHLESIRTERDALRLQRETDERTLRAAADLYATLRVELAGARQAEAAMRTERDAARASDEKSIEMYLRARGLGVKAEDERDALRARVVMLVEACAALDAVCLASIQSQTPLLPSLMTQWREARERIAAATDATPPAKCSGCDLLNGEHRFSCMVAGVRAGQVVLPATVDAGGKVTVATRGFEWQAKDLDWWCHSRGERVTTCATCGGLNGTHTLRDCAGQKETP